MAVPLAQLLDASPYLRDLNERHGDWLGAALADPDATLRQELAALGPAALAAGADEATIGDALRRAKGRVALLAAAAETGGLWTTAQSTAALSDLADAALDAGLTVLLQRAIDKGDLVATTPAACGLAIFALGKHGGRELNYSSDIDIVAFFDSAAGVLADPDDATKVYSRIVQRLAALL